MRAASEARKTVSRPQSRRRSSGSGRVWFSERDGELLEIVGEQYAITVRQLAQLIGRSERTARWLRDRWRRARWIESAPLTRNGPSFLWLTPEGIRTANSPYRTWRPNANMLAHIEAVTDVRLLLERELRLGRWLSERWLVSVSPPRSQRRPHLPDGLLDTSDETYAIEVELTLKSRARLAAIVNELGEQYAQVWYFAAAPLVPALEEIAATTRHRNVRVFHYPLRPGELYT
jgi:hypothetical protein